MGGSLFGVSIILVRSSIQQVAGGAALSLCRQLYGIVKIAHIGSVWIVRHELYRYSIVLHF